MRAGALLPGRVVGRKRGRDQIHTRNITKLRGGAPILPPRDFAGGAGEPILAAQRDGRSAP